MVRESWFFVSGNVTTPREKSTPLQVKENASEARQPVRKQKRVIFHAWGGAGLECTVFKKS
jgi:hypothetical protein